MRTIAPALLSLLCLAGCTTRKQVAGEPLDAGVMAVYRAPFDKVKRAALDAVAELAFGVKEEKWEDERRYKIVCSQGVASGTIGRYARVVIETADTECTVYVIVKSKAAGAEARPVDDTIAADLQKRILKRVEKP